MREKKSKIAEKDLQGFKYFKKLSGLLHGLHEAGCARDRAHNRILHMDQYMTLLLLCLFSPICTSLRAMQQASCLAKVQKKLRVPRSSLGSLSESARLFDSSLLQEIIEELVGELKHTPSTAALKDVRGIITLVDGTLLKELPRTVEALWQDADHKAYKVHLQYELLKGVPVSAEVTGANISEKAVFSDHLESNRLYVMDRGYVKYGLFQEIIDKGSSFVCRIYDQAVFEPLEERAISQKANEAGVRRDVLVRLGTQHAGRALTQPVRIVELECTECSTRNAHAIRRGLKPGNRMWLATDRMDLPAETIGFIYRCRWQIEIFFRFFKHILGCRHLLSYNQNGIELQTYAAIIACLLISLYTGRKPTLRTYEMLCWNMIGWASDEELSRHIEGLKKQD